jgi:hypothetical protein
MTTVFSNIDSQAAIGPVHALSPGTWLSCVRPAVSQEPNAGITIDQIAAQQIGQDTPLPSLEVATDVRGGGGFCDRDYGCSYAGTISFRTPTTPLPMENDPRKLFIRLFGQGDNAAERARLSKQYGSLLDMLTGEVNSLQRSLGPSDKACCPTISRPSAKSSAAFRRLEARDLSNVDIPDAPAGTPPVRSAHQPDVRPGRAGVSGEHDARLHLHDGGRGQRPDLQPHRRVRRLPSAVAPQQRSRRRWTAWSRSRPYHTQVFAKFLDKLAAMPDGDGTMLDHSLFLYGSNMSNSNAHNHYPLPTSFVGGWKTVKGNRHVVAPEKTPLSNVLLTFLDKINVPRTSWATAPASWWTPSHAGRSWLRAFRPAAFRRLLAVGLISVATAPSAAFAADVVDASGSTPLLVAASNDDVAQVKQLLKAGANPNVRNKLDTTPLLEAAFHSNSEIIKALLDAGADPNAAGADGQTPLMLVARGTNVAAAKMLLEKGANPRAREAQRRQTALMWAAANSQGPMTRLLVEVGRGAGRTNGHRP